MKHAETSPSGLEPADLLADALELAAAEATDDAWSARRSGVAEGPLALAFGEEPAGLARLAARLTDAPAAPARPSPEALRAIEQRLVARFEARHRPAPRPVPLSTGRRRLPLLALGGVAAAIAVVAVLVGANPFGDARVGVATVAAATATGTATGTSPASRATAAAAPTQVRRQAAAPERADRRADRRAADPQPAAASGGSRSGIGMWPAAAQASRTSATRNTEPAATTTSSRLEAASASRRAAAGLAQAVTEPPRALTRLARSPAGIARGWSAAAVKT
jgi:hypothetical protein